MFTECFILASFYLFKVFINFELVSYATVTALNFPRLDLFLYKKIHMYINKTQCSTQVLAS